MLLLGNALTVSGFVNYLRDQDAPHDAATTEKAAREGVLAEITNHLRESWE